MTKKSIVTSCQADGSWTSKKYGTEFYRFEIAFENGDSGEYSSKSVEQTKFVTGQEAEYTIENNGYGNKIKPVSSYEGGNTGSSSSGGYKSKGRSAETELSIVRQSSLKCATDYVIANGGDELRVIEVAELLTAWVQTGQKPEKQPEQMPF